MKINTHPFSVLLATSLLSSCGGGGGSSKDAVLNNDSEDKSLITSKQISGTAIKGVIKNGTVSAYGVADGKKDLSPLGISSTDDQGNYSLTINNYNGPVIIEISANSNTTMICDIMEGCDDKMFGEELSLDDDFSLKTAIPATQSDKNITANVTVLTSLATAYAESHDSLDAVVVTKANSQVATLLNITGDITEMDIIDITDLNAMESVDGEAKENAILNSALLAATLKNNASNVSIAKALKLLVAEFALQDGQMINHEINNSEKIALSEVFDEAIEIINHNYYKEINFGTSRPNLQITLARAEEKADEYTTAIAKEPAVKDAVKAAKNMVETIRKFGLQSTYESADELSVIKQIELVTSLSHSTELNALSNAIETASIMFAEANSANMDALETNEIALNSYNYPGQNESTIPVSIAEINNGYRYHINSPLTGSAPDYIATNLDLYAEISMEEVEQELSTEISDDFLKLGVVDDSSEQPNRPAAAESIKRSNGFNASLKLSGSLSSQYHDVTISNGDIDASIYEDLSAWFNGQGAVSEWDEGLIGSPLIYSEQRTDGGLDDFARGWNINNVALNLEISQRNIDNPVIFAGKLSFLPTYSNYGGLNSLITMASFNRAVTAAYFAEDNLPILELGLEPQNVSDPIERPLYSSDIVITGNIFGVDALTLSGEFRQNNNSVKAILTGSSNTHRATWGGISQPGDISDILTRSSMADSFDQISGGDDPRRQSENFDQISGGYLESYIAFGATIEDLIDLTDEFNNQTDYSYAVSQQDITSLGIALEFKTSTVSDITGLNISTAYDENSNQLLSMDIALGSSRLDLDITYPNNKPQLTVTDQNNTQLQITEDCIEMPISCDNIGVVTVKGATAATISYDQEKDLYIIEYNDNSYEVL